MRENLKRLQVADDYKVIRTNYYPVTHDAEAGRFGSYVCRGYIDVRAVFARGQRWEKDVTTHDIFVSID